MNCTETQSIRTQDAFARLLAFCASVAMLIVCVSCSPQPTAPNPPIKEGPVTDVQPTDDDATVEPEATVEPDTPTDPQPETEAVDHTGQVLRHAVFFKFKETSTDEQIAEVAKAFEALPEKIDTITDFQWGTNNSEEGFDDGFTHCFLLTFQDEAGRSVYLPHAEHKAFGDVLRPHMEDVFVIDYWATPSANPPEQQLKHAVFVKFKDDASPEDVKAAEEGFGALQSKIDTIKGFEWGKNNSPEKKDDGFTHCFMVTFDSVEGRDAYLPHAEHQAFVEVLKPVMDKVRVLDFLVQE